MIESIVHSSDPITLVGGGEATPQDLQEVLTLAPLCVAVDGGAALVLATGVMPDAVIGDFDSAPSDLQARIPPDQLYHITEQDSTDFEKALGRVSAPLALGVGFLGGRLDHQLASLHVLARYAHQPCVLLGPQEAVLLAPPAITLPTLDGEVVSLFPIAPVQGRSTGLVWPIEGLAFDPLCKIGTSNRATGPCTLEFDAPCMLLMVPRRLIQPLVATLQRPDALRWPVRAE